MNWNDKKLLAVIVRVVLAVIKFENASKRKLKRELMKYCWSHRMYIGPRGWCNYCIQFQNEICWISAAHRFRPAAFSSSVICFISIDFALRVFWTFCIKGLVNCKHHNRGKNYETHTRICRKAKVAHDSAPRLTSSGFVITPVNFNYLPFRNNMKYCKIMSQIKFIFVTKRSFNVSFRFVFLVFCKNK